MSIKLTSSGAGAVSDTVNDLQKAINEMNAAIAELNSCKGLGAELYIEKLNSMVSTYTNIKNVIGRIH